MTFSIRARIAALGACALVIAIPAGPLSAEPRSGAPATKQLTFKPGVDASAWYWVPQKDQEVGAGPAVTRQKLPNPQRPTTLPIAYERGEPSKVSALKFDLADRGVPPASKVTKFQLTIVEETEAGEVPTANPNKRVLQACSADSGWTAADEPELWEAMPKAGTECAKGVRKEKDLAEREESLVTWTFDLSKVATEWGVDPFGNHGVVFSGVVPGEAGATETWQVNLKVPERDNANTPTVDEAKKTADRVKATMTYLPGAAKDPGAVPGGVGGAPGGGAAPGADAPAGGAPPAGGDTPAPGESSDLASGTPFKPTMPWYVWLLIPAALVASYLVRGALSEGTGSTGGGGVIELIKRQNAARRGGPIPGPMGPWARLTGAIAARRGR